MCALARFHLASFSGQVRRSEIFHKKKTILTKLPNDAWARFDPTTH
jgi:hypothetical protein